MLESGTLGTSLFPPGKEGPLALEVGGGYNDTSISTFLTSAPEKVPSPSHPQGFLCH